MTSVPVGGTVLAPTMPATLTAPSLKARPEVNLGFALGGWTLSDEFGTAYATQEGRDKFVGEAVHFETYDFFNVVDFDWEYPGGGGKAGNAVSASDGANFELVLRDLRTALDDLSARPVVTLVSIAGWRRRSWPSSTSKASAPTSTFTT